MAAQFPDLTGEGEFDLVRVFDELLRMRPDQVLIGEVRGDETRVLRRALLSGEGGIWTTLHARRPSDICDRLADLSGDSAASWNDYLAKTGAVCLVMDREKPRFREAWVLSSSGWQIIFSATKETGRKEFV